MAARSSRIKKGLTQEAVELARAGEPEVVEVEIETEKVKDEEYEASLTKIYGNREPPDNDNVLPLRLPPPINSPVVPNASSIETRLDEFAHSHNCTCNKCQIGARLHRVSIVQDSILTYPELFFDVYVATDARYEEAQFAEMFVRSRCKKAKSIDTADLVVFTGGVDVDPALYGEKAHYKTNTPSRLREIREIKLYDYCLKNGIAMFGVCRGAQFLTVMNGGGLFQDVDNHNGEHSMWDMVGKEHIDRVSSVHHQMVKPNTLNGMTIIGTSHMSTKKTSLNHKGEWQEDRKTAGDIEAFFYRDTACLGVQGHPEYRGYNQYTQWVLKQIEQFISHSPDFAWGGNKYRMKDELRVERAKALRDTAVLYLNERAL